MRRLILGSTLLLLVACNESPTETGTGETVTMSTSAFAPQELTIDAGTEVTWLNQSNATHTVEPIGHNQWDTFDSTTNGQRNTVRFDTPGSYEYQCTQHVGVGMIGTIIVEAP